MSTIDGQVTRIVMIRHGESASNAGKWISGQESCGGLTDLGVTQATALRDRLAADESMRPDTILASTMRRAVHTAEIIAEPTGLTVEQRAELIERTSGEAEGLTVDEYVDRYGVRPWTDWVNPLSPGGESGEEFESRVRAATDRVVEQHRGRTVWVVCHGGVIMLSAMRRWADHGAAVVQALSIETLPVSTAANTAVSEWSVDPGGVWQMARYNDHTHLVGVVTPVSQAGR